MTVEVCSFCHTECESQEARGWKVIEGHEQYRNICPSCILRVLNKEVWNLTPGCFEVNAPPSSLLEHAKVESAAPKPPKEVDFYVWRNVEDKLVVTNVRPDVAKVPACDDTYLCEQKDSRFFTPTFLSDKPEVKNTVFHFKARLVGTMVPRSQIVWHEEVK